MEPPSDALQSEHGWTTQNPDTRMENETVYRSNRLSAGASNAGATVDLTDAAAQDGSYGTLMLSEGGRSKYLGPTAGSEWLRDVCEVTADIKKKLKSASLRSKALQVHRLHCRLVRPAQRRQVSPCLHNDITLPLEGWLEHFRSVP